MATARVVPADPEPVVVPVHVRNAAIGIARPGTKGPINDIQMLTGFIEELQLVEQTLLKSFFATATLFELVSRQVFVLIVGFNAVAHPNCVSAILGGAVGDDDLVQILVGIFQRREQFHTLVEQALGSHSLRNNNQVVKARLALGNFHSRKIQLKAKNVAVELGPAGQKLLGRLGFNQALALHKRLQKQAKLLGVALVIHDKLAHHGPQFKQPLENVRIAITHGFLPIKELILPVTHRIIGAKYDISPSFLIIHLKTSFVKPNEVL